MKVVPNNKIVFFDVDDTLVLWNSSLHEKSIKFDCHGFEENLIPHKNNIKMLKHMKRKGYTVVVWSQGGYEWAESVVKTPETVKLESAVISPLIATVVSDTMSRVPSADDCK